jgi:hypothetical protein
LGKLADASGALSRPPLPVTTNSAPVTGIVAGPTIYLR